MYVCKRPCYVQLERMAKLEHELEMMKQEIVGRMKIRHSLTQQLASPHSIHLFAANRRIAESSSSTSQPCFTQCTPTAFLRFLIRNSSAPECWRTVPSEVKPMHQALLLIHFFAPPPCHTHQLNALYDPLLGLGDQASSTQRRVRAIIFRNV